MRGINCMSNDPTASFASRFFFNDNVWSVKINSVSRKNFMTVASYFLGELKTSHGPRLFQGQPSTCFYAPSGKTWLSRMPEHLEILMYFDFREVYNV